MTQLALDKGTYDLFKPAGGGVLRVDKGRFVVQQVQSKLKTILGEWLLDTKVGWLNTNDFDRNFSTFDLESRAKKIIEATKGVRGVDTLTSQYSKRKLEISFTAKTIYGEINQTISWDNTNIGG